MGKFTAVLAAFAVAVATAPGISADKEVAGAGMGFAAGAVIAGLVGAVAGGFVGAMIGGPKMTSKPLSRRVRLPGRALQ